MQPGALKVVFPLAFPSGLHLSVAFHCSRNMLNRNDANSTGSCKAP